MVVVAAPFSSPAGCEDRSRCDLPHSAVQFVSVHAGRLALTDPLDWFAGFRVDGTGKHRLSSATTSADPQFDDHAVGLGVFELHCCLRDGPGEVCGVKPVRSRLGLPTEDGRSLRQKAAGDSDCVPTVEVYI